jgi:hypothetical protein
VSGLSWRVNLVSGRDAEGCQEVGRETRESEKKKEEPTVRPVPSRPSPSTISERPEGESSRRWFSMPGDCLAGALNQDPCAVEEVDG